MEKNQNYVRNETERQAAQEKSKYFIFSFKQ